MDSVPFKLCASYTVWDNSPASFLPDNTVARGFEHSNPEIFDLHIFSLKKMTLHRVILIQGIILKLKPPPPEKKILPHH